MATNTYDSALIVSLFRTHLENVERLKLDIPTLVAQEVHHHLEIGLGADISGHDAVIGSIEQDLSKKFEGLSFGDIVGGQYKRSIHCEELLVSWYGRSCKNCELTLS